MIEMMSGRKMNGLGLIVVFLVLISSSRVLVSEVIAHSPLGADNNESLATATVVPDATKSWAIYAELHEGGEAQYYRFNATTGQRIHVMLFKSTDTKDKDFQPGFVLMGPSIAGQGQFPDYVEKPSGAKALTVEGIRASKATYEPFSPGNFYSLADLALDAPALGTYYVAVYESYRGGHYGLAIGDRESYTPVEWFLIPLNLVKIYQWEGQSLIFVFLPMAITLAVGVGLLVWRRVRIQALGEASGWLGSLAGLLFIGTGAMTFHQMIFSVVRTSFVPEVAVTIVFVLIPVLLGIGVIRFSLRTQKKPSLRNRIYIATIGCAALVVWAGLYVGTVLAIAASILYRVR